MSSKGLEIVMARSKMQGGGERSSKQLGKIICIILPKKKITFDELDFKISIILIKLYFLFLYQLPFLRRLVFFYLLYKK